MSQITARGFFLSDPGVVPRHYTVSEPDFFQSPEVRLPRRGITVGYGSKGLSSVNRAAIRKAADENFYLSSFNFNLEIGQWNPKKLSLESISDCRFLNLPVRASAAVMDDINGHWNHWLALEGEPEERFPRRPSNRMDLLDRLIELPPYNQLTAIAYDIMTNHGIAKFLTIYNLDAIDHESIAVVPGGITKIDFKLPT